MAKARQQYQADGNYVDKQEKEFSLTQEIIEKLDSIEPSAERNAIQGVKVNGELQTPDQYRVVSLTIPEVIDELNSTDNKSSLSARQGRVLYNYIKNLQSLGKFLSNWNATTGLPTTNPSGVPYEYHTGDYFVVSLIGATNYRPSGTTYEGIASSVIETEEVKVGDIYFFDGVERLLMLNTERKIPIDTSLSTTSENVVENRVVTQALNLKANDADISIVGKTNNYNDLSNRPNVPDSLDDLSGTSDDITEGTTHLFLTTGERTKLTNTEGTNTGDETPSSIKTKLGQASTSTDGYLTSTDWNTFNNKQASISDLATIRSNAQAGKTASDTIATYGDIVTHDADEFATAAQGVKADSALQSGDNISELTNDAGYITSSALPTVNNGTLTIKQNSTSKGTFTANQSGNSTIELTDTTYTANDFDIKDLSDSTGLRSAWTGKQDKLQAGVNIEISSDGKTISAKDTTYTAGTGIDITNGVISSTQTSAEWGNITGTLSDQTDLQNALNNKQDTLTPGNNIQIAPDGTISATDTTYSAVDFDIKDLADSTNLRSTWSGKQNAISDLATIRSGAALGTTSIQPGDDISELNNDAGYITSASLPTVNNGALTIQKNGTNVATFTANQSGNSTANLIIPTTASDVGALPSSTKYGASLSLSLNTTTYVVTATLKDQDGNTLGTAQTIDLPLESVVVSGSYDATNKKVVLTLKDGSTIDFSVADLISGLQSEITSTNKLSADLIADGTTNKVVTAAEKSTWSGKQNAISDLATIRSGAALGATALQSISSGDVTSALGYTPANDTSVVKTSGNQTIAGTKTFSTSPVVPSKTSTATNSGTAIATEAQVYAKQDKLTAGENIKLANNVISANNVFIITEDDVTVSTSEETGVAPYNTSYKYTNIDINANAGIEWREGAIYTFVVNTEMVVASAYRNVRVRIGSGAYIPFMSSSSVIAGHSYFVKTQQRQFQYSTKYQSGGALHLFTDTNTTYSAMTAAEISAGTGTTARTITPANLKTAIQTWSPTVNDAIITFTQGGTTMGDITMNQNSAETIAFQGDIFTTQSNYDNLPSSKLTDGNTYFIYE